MTTASKHENTEESCSNASKSSCCITIPHCSKSHSCCSGGRKSPRKKERKTKTKLWQSSKPRRRRRRTSTTTQQKAPPQFDDNGNKEKKKNRRKTTNLTQVSETPQHQESELPHHDAETRNSPSHHSPLPPPPPPSLRSSLPPPFLSFFVPPHLLSIALLILRSPASCFPFPCLTAAASVDSIKNQKKKKKKREQEEEEEESITSWFPRRRSRRSRRRPFSSPPPRARNCGSARRTVVCSTARVAAEKRWQWGRGTENRQGARTQRNAAESVRGKRAHKRGTGSQSPTRACSLYPICKRNAWIITRSGLRLTVPIFYSERNQTQLNAIGAAGAVFFFFWVCFSLPIL